MNQSVHLKPAACRVSPPSLRVGAVAALAAAAAVAFAATVALSPASAHELPGEGPLKVDPIVGYWVGTVTVIDCASKTPLFSFDSGQLINHGGTINTTDYTNPPTSSGPGFGIWSRQRDGGYFVRFRFVQFTPDGQVSGFRVVTKKVTLVDGQTQSSEIRSAAQDSQGNTLGTRCATEVATRFK